MLIYISIPTGERKRDCFIVGVRRHGSRRHRRPRRLQCTSDERRTERLPYRSGTATRRYYLYLFFFPLHSSLPSALFSLSPRCAHSLTLARATYSFLDSLRLAPSPIARLSLSLSLLFSFFRFSFCVLSLRRDSGSELSRTRTAGTVAVDRAVDPQQYPNLSHFF